MKAKDIWMLIAFVLILAAAVGLGIAQTESCMRDTGWSFLTCLRLR